MYLKNEKVKLFRLLCFLFFIFTGEITQSQAADEEDFWPFNFEESTKSQTENFPQPSDDEDDAPLKQRLHFSNVYQSGSGLAKSDPIPIPLNRAPVTVTMEFDESDESDESMPDKYFDLKTHLYQRTQRLVSKD